jgi:hypothetical protein
MPIVDEEHLQLAGQIDEHLRRIWEAKGPSSIWAEIMAKFDEKRSENVEAEFVLFISLTKLMLEDEK